MLIPSDRSVASPVPARPVRGLGPVCLLPVKPNQRPGGHEHVTLRHLAGRLAALLGVPFHGDCDGPSDSARYVVPDDTLVSIEAAHALGIFGVEHLFGGVVPFPHVATKTISHPLIDDADVVPLGWSAAFGERVREVVLPGYSAFSMADAQRAGMELLRDGAVRIKKAEGTGGTGQAVASDPRQLQATLEAFGDEGAWHAGVALERNLAEVVTHSVGQVRVGTLVATYCGLQRLTRNHHGHEVYGGSRLEVVRGDYDVLLGRELAPEVRIAIQQARDFQCAAFECYPGMFASRCNYDIAQGRDEAGHWRSGVLEQSWRIGGASGAEIAALEAFDADPSLQQVCAATAEVYDAGVTLPPGAVICFSGQDAKVGELTKYSWIEPA